MADRNHTETGSEQHTILDNDQKSGTTVGHRANVRRDDTLGASFPNEFLSPEEERKFRKAQDDALKHSTRDDSGIQQLPHDTSDPDFGQGPGPKNPHKP
jgi:hypothetical protein